MAEAWFGAAGGVESRSSRSALGIDRSRSGGEAIRSADPTDSAGPAARRAVFLRIAEARGRDSRIVGGNGQHPNGAGADGVDPGNPDGRFLARCDDTDSGKRAKEAARSGEADRESEAQA